MAAERGRGVVQGERAPAGVPDPDPDEHIRFARYRRALGPVAPEDAADLVARVLTDPDPAMANSAVCEYLDRRAAELLTDPGYPAWCRELTGPVAVDGFTARRLRERSLLRAIAVDEPWDAEELLAASTWLQPRVAEGSLAPAALAVLAGDGRTRRVRTIAGSRIPRPG